MYKDYKANRKECPPELVQQMPFFRDISKNLGLPIFELEGFEADDIIGTIAHELGQKGTDVTIVSGDKDVLQLINPHVQVWDTMKDQIFSAPQVQEKLGVLPERCDRLSSACW